MSESTNNVAKNTFFLYFRMILIMAVSIYTSRVIIQVLGVEDFGIYNVICGITALFTSISSSLGGASNRFITYSLGVDNEKEQREVFSTTVIVHIGISILIVLLCETIGLYFLYYELNIPSDRFDAAYWAFQYSIISLVFLFVNLPYNSIIIANEKMKVFAYISIVDILLRLFVVYLLDYFVYDKLAFYGFLLMAVQILVQMIYWVYCRRKYSITSLIFVRRLKLVRDMFSYSTWIFLGTLSTSIITQGTTILLNIFYGPIVNAAMGIATQVQNAIMRFAQNFQTAIKPQIIKRYAQGNIEGMYGLVVSGTKLSAYLLLFLSLPVFFQTETILEIWLDDIPPRTDIFIKLLIITCLIHLYSYPLMFSLHATSNIKRVQIWELSKIFAIPTSWIILSHFKVPPYFILIVNILFEIFFSYVRIKIILDKFSIPRRTFICDALTPVIKTFCASLVMPCLISFLTFDSKYIEFFVSAFICLFSVVISAFFWGLTSNERLIVLTKISNKLK